MSLRISVVEDKARKSPSNRPLREYKSSMLPSNHFYIRPNTSYHVSRRNKSPFQKYEQCIKKTTLQKQPPKATSPGLFIRKSPIDPKLLSNNNLKKVNKFEDLVIEAVNSGPFSQSNNLICYKKKYLVNLSESSLNLANIVSDSIEANSVEETRVNDYKSENVLLCSRCKTKLNEDEAKTSRNISPNKKTVRFGDEGLTDKKQTKIPDVITRQPPLGAPENLNEKPMKKNLFNFDDDSLIDIKLDPETAEQFINLLIAEDAMLRKKLAEGNVDPRTLKKLERLNELRQKYIEYKKGLESQIANTKTNLIKEPTPESEQKEPEIKKSFIQFQIVHQPIDIKPPKLPNNLLKIDTSNKKSKIFQFKESGLCKVKSLSDPAFSLELRHHPLVRE